jgi:hypothetical protein
MVVFGASFIGLMLLPVDFTYSSFAMLIAANGIGVGMFASPNTSAIMSSVPPERRGVASGMRATFQNSGSLLSIGIFFSLMIGVLSINLPRTLTGGLEAQGVPHDAAQAIGALPPVSSLFAAFLGVNPIQHQLEPSGVLTALPAANRAALTGREFFPHLISGPFHDGLLVVFGFSLFLSMLAAFASLLRGGRYVHPAKSHASH